MAYGYVTPYRRPSGWSTFQRNGSDMLSDLNRQINRLFDDVFDFDGDEGDFRDKRSKRMNAPAMDIDVSDDSYELTAELPGVKSEDVELRVEDNLLILKGEKKSTRTGDDNSWSERRFGQFQRRIQLPDDIAQDEINADFSDGVLTVTMPRTQKATKSRTVSISTGGDTSTGRLIDDDSTKIEENA